MKRRGIKAGDKWLFDEEDAFRCSNPDIFWDAALEVMLKREMVRFAPTEDGGRAIYVTGIGEFEVGEAVSSDHATARAVQFDWRKAANTIKDAMVAELRKKLFGRWNL